MNTSSTEVAMLEELIESGAFASQTESYLNRTFRNGARDTWYAETRATKGHDEAERQLADWVKHWHHATFASSIEPIARSLVTLAKAKDGGVIDIAGCRTSVYSRIGNLLGPRYKFVAMNTSAPGHRCTPLKGEHVWGPGGLLGLRAVILETGYTREGPTVDMTLVLPTWARSGRTAGTGANFFARIEADGTSWGDLYTVYTQNEEGGREVVDSDLALRLLLGMTRPNGKIQTSSLSSGVDELIGFPGASDYLSAKLPELSDYFTAVAEEINRPHKH